MNLRRFILLSLLIALHVGGIEQASAFYNPSTGRWLSKDPIEERGGANLYAMVSNDPLNKTDALGLSASDMYAGKISLQMERYSYKSIVNIQYYSKHDCPCKNLRFIQIANTYINAGGNITSLPWQIRPYRM